MHPLLKELARLPLFAQGLANARALTFQFVPGGWFQAQVEDAIVRAPALPVVRDGVPLGSCAGTLSDLTTIYYGGIYHECAHLKHTMGHTRWRDIPKSEITDALRHLANAIEDPRIERESIREFPGSAKHLEAMNRLLNREPADSAFAAIVKYAMALLRDRYGVCSRTPEEMEGYFQEVVACAGPGVANSLDVIVEQAAITMSSTRDACNVAYAVLRMVADEAAKAQQQADEEAATEQASQDGAVQPGNSGDPQDDQGPSNTQSGNATGASQGAPDDAQEASPQASTGEASAGSGHSAGDLAQLLRDTLDGNTGPDPEQQAKALAQQLLRELKDAGLVSGAAQDVVQPNDDSDRPHEQRGQLKLGGKTPDLNVVRSSTAELRNKLVAQLQSRGRRRNLPVDRGVRLHQRKLVSAMLGDPRVFSRIAKARTVDTAVFVLADVSGSMDGEPLRLTTDAILATGLAIEQIRGAKVAVGAFPGNGLLHGFGTQPSSSLDRYALDSWGGTPMGSAIAWATKVLHARREPRRIIVVVTDGDPDDAGSVKRAVSTASSVGIEVCGLGIYTDSVRQLFRRSEVITSMTDLAPAMFRLLQSNFLRDAA